MHLPPPTNPVLPGTDLNIDPVARHDWSGEVSAYRRPVLSQIQGIDYALNATVTGHSVIFYTALNS